MSVYPQALDTDLELPRVDENITEMGGDAINSLRNAVFNIEHALGLNPAGTKPSLADRINMSLDAEGRIKASALNEIGVVTLPITNAQIGATAAIVESKLDLDHPTQTLRNLISSLQTDVVGLQTGVAAITSRFNLHVIGQGDFHDGYQIKINTGTFVGVGGLVATTIGDAVNEIAGHLFGVVNGREPHIDFSLPTDIKHVASKVSVDTSNFSSIDRTVKNVQEALDGIDQQVLSQQSGHVDGFHANGILKEINSGEFFNPNQQKFRDTSSSYTQGSTVVTIPSIASFASIGVKSGDILYVEDTTGSIMDAGSHKIRAVGPLVAGDTLGGLPTLASNQLSVFHVFEETQASITVDGYEAASVSSENAPLACSVRNNTTLVDTPTILNPDAARVVSLGFNGAVLNGDGYDIHLRVGLTGGVYRELTIPNLNRERLAASQASPVDATSVAERINAYVSDPVLAHHFPVSAFRIGNEIAIAHNLVGEEFTLEVLDGYTGNLALGLDAYGADVAGLIVTGNSDNLYNVNGISLSSVRTLVDGYASIASASDTFGLLYSSNGTPVNPTALGIDAGAVLHITGHPTLDTNGSYTIETTTSSTVKVFTSETIDAPSPPTTFNVKITDSNISLNVLDNAELDNGLVQLLVDQTGKVLVHQRMAYGTTLGAAAEVVNVSSDFPTGDITLTLTSSGTLRSFTLIEDSLSGLSATIHEDFKGTLKVYHPNNISFISVEIGPGALGTASETLVVYDNINKDEAMPISMLHFNGEKLITNVIDLRQFGNLGADQARDDLLEVFSQVPVADLRSNGVARGFDNINLPFLDSLTNMQALPLNGGTAYVNGVRCVVETQKVVIQSHDSSGSILPDRTVVVGINEFGTIRAFDDTLGEILSDGYNSSAEFGKILPLYTVDMVSGGIDTVTDVRRFINNIDEKLELVVDETNNVVGNFRSLEGALLYADKYPNAEKLTIRILNKVFPSRKLVVPRGVSIVGNSIFGGTGKHAIVNQNDLNDNFIELTGDNRIENVQVESEVVAMDGTLVYISGSNVEIDKCLVTFTDSNPIATSSANFGVEIASTATQDVRITNNRIDNVFSGIVGLSGCDRLTITGNNISNVAGTSAVAYGVFIGTSATAVDHLTISDNIVLVGNIGAGSDIRGISVDVGETIGTLRVNDNTITHEDNNTMTNGIRIENSATTGNTVSEAMIYGNVVNGIKLNDNDIWGIYMSDVDTGYIKDNVLKNIGQSGNTDYGYIRALNTDFLTIDGNVLQDGDVTRGIDVSSITNKVIITNNELSELGSSAFYIFGAGTHSTISNNSLTGPGAQGIRWTGANSAINGNNLNAEGGSYAFSEYGIFTLASDIDIANNTITGMTFSEDSIGISSGGAGRDRLKITNNTIAGSLMSSLIQLFGSDHLVSGNRMFNSVNSSSLTGYIELNAVSDALITGNKFQGAGQDGIVQVGAVDGMSITNNKFIATFAVAPINMSTATNTFFTGNDVPSGSTIFLGTDPVQGVNKNILDSIAIHAINGFPDEDADPWAFDNGDFYWYPDASGGTFSIYFSLEGVPNGAKLTSVLASGRRENYDFTVTVYRTLLAAPRTVTSVASGTVSSGTDVFGGTSVSSEVIDHSTYSYMVEVQLTGGGSPGDERVQGIRAFYRY